MLSRFQKAQLAGERTETYPWKACFASCEAVLTKISWSNKEVNNPLLGVAEEIARHHRQVCKREVVSA